MDLIHSSQVATVLQALTAYIHGQLVRSRSGPRHKDPVSAGTEHRKLASYSVPYFSWKANRFVLNLFFRVLSLILTHGVLWAYAIDYRLRFSLEQENLTETLRGWKG